jgi:hypothetical protein
MKRVDGTWTSSSPPCTYHWVWLYPLLTKGSVNELYIPGTGEHNDSNKYYLLYITKPQDGVWSDTIICGVVGPDAVGHSFGLALRNFICDNEGRLFFIGEKSEDIYCIEYKRQ